MTQEENKTVPRDWWAVYTRHQHEKAVAENLASHSYEAFLPLYEAVRQWKDRKKRLSLPLFPCYVFVRGEWERRIDVLSTPGAHSILMSAGHPATNPENEIDEIRRA